MVKEGCRALNDWALDFQQHSPRFVCVASIPLVDIDDAVAEVKRAHEGGFLCGFLPVRPPVGRPEWNDEEWDPLWAAFAETGMVIGFHIGTEPHDPTQRTGRLLPGPRRRRAQLRRDHLRRPAGRHPAHRLRRPGPPPRAQGPGVGGRGHLGPVHRRPHGRGLPPARRRGAARRSRSCPSRYLYEQVYASFQHDISAVAANAAMGWQNVMWGSDYPHFEGTFGHTQKTLHELFDGVDPAVSRRIRIGAFQELFPSVPPPPGGLRPAARVDGDRGGWPTEDPFSDTL